jgi:hypothetical protein
MYLDDCSSRWTLRRASVCLGICSLWAVNCWAAESVPPNTSVVPGTDGCHGVVLGEGAVWGLNGKGIKTFDFPLRQHVREQYVVRIDPATSQVTAQSGPLPEPYRVGINELAVGAGAVWAAVDYAPPAVLKIDPVSGQIVQRIDLRKRRYFDPHKVWVAVGDGLVWAAVYSDKVLYRIDPRTNDVASISLRDSPEDLTAGLGAVWVQMRESGGYVLDRIDPVSQRVVSTMSAPPGTEIIHSEVGAGSVWTLVAVKLPSGRLSEDNHLVRLDPSSGRITAEIDLGATVSTLAPTDRAVWVATYRPNDAHPESTAQITQIDPEKNAIVRTISVSTVGNRPIASPRVRIDVLAEHVWVCAPGVGIFRIL